MKALSWLIAVPLALLAVAFAVANRQAVRLELWPLPFAAELPAYLAVLGSLAVGLVAGALLTWAGGAPARRRARTERRRADSLQRQLDAATAVPAALPAPPSESNP